MIALDPRPRRFAVLAFFASSAALVACSSTAAPKSLDASAGAWLRPSPVLEQQLRDEAERLPWSHGIERMEQIRWFAAVGEPAYPLLLDLVDDPQDHVSAAALAALGATGDARLVAHIHAIPWPASRHGTDLHLERARTLVRLGDWSEIPTLIQGLRDERIYTRALCDQALEQTTHRDLEFDPRGAENERENAVRRWEDWWTRRQSEGLLGAGER